MAAHCDMTSNVAAHCDMTSKIMTWLASGINASIILDKQSLDRTILAPLWHVGENFKFRILYKLFCDVYLQRCQLM